MALNRKEQLSFHLPFALENGVARRVDGNNHASGVLCRAVAGRGDGTASVSHVANKLNGGNQHAFYLISLKGKSPDYLRAVSDALHTALVDTFEVPDADRFQAIHQHEKTELI